MQLSEKDMFDLAYQTVLDIQGNGSGFDIAAAVYGGTLYFVGESKKIEKLPIKKLPIIIGYSGIKADTASLIHTVFEKAQKYPHIVYDIYQLIDQLVQMAKSELKAQNWKTFGELMNMNQGLLESLGVSTNTLSSMIYAARESAAYGAKLSGAGGGDCMIAIAPEDTKNTVEHAIKKAGGQIISAQTNAEGVRVEK